MEELYKSQLKKMRLESSSKSYSDALFSSIGWELTKKQTLEKTESHEAPLSVEKGQVMESFQKYSEEKIKEEGKIEFNGGVITFKKPLPSHYNGEQPGNVKFLDFEKLFQKGIELYGESIMKIRYQQSCSPGIKILFVTDKFSQEALSEGTPVRQMLSCFFEEEVNTLFEKMISAMKLSVDDVLISKSSSDENETEFLNQEILYYRPRFVMTLGASSSNRVLGIKERLSNIHGQFFKRVFNKDDINEFQFVVCPLFNPEFLLINPNMKRTAWSDMQKVMKELGQKV